MSAAALLDGAEFIGVHTEGHNVKTPLVCLTLNRQTGLNHFQYV
jgi:hypothetical protein